MGVFKWVDDLKRYSVKDDVHMANKHVRFSPKVGIKGIHIKTKMHSKLIKCTKSETETIATLDKDAKAETPRQKPP